MEASSFLRTRARLQRLKDYKLLSGWVTMVSKYEVVIRLNGENILDAEDAVFVQAFGDKVTGQFTGKVLSSRGQSSTIAFTTEVKCVTAIEELRLKTDLVLGELDAGGFKMEFQVVDVSPSGVGILTKLPLTRGATIQMRMDEGAARVDCEAEVRYCRSLGEGDLPFRSGLKLGPLDRLNQARWNQFVESLMEAA
ncbi:MAG: PilZ domain-containing protein [Fimbriimonadaceae bacterium]|nr:PilZ domain-containing protein [Fimbriimonadaceae bacterium]